VKREEEELMVRVEQREGTSCSLGVVLRVRFKAIESVPSKF